MYYLIDNDEDLRYEDVESVLEYCVNTDYYEEDEDGFDDYINSDGEVDIEGYSYLPSQILREMGDYNEAIRGWAQDQVESSWSDYRWEINRLRNGDSCWVCNYEVFAYDNDEEEPEEKPDENAIETIETQVEITVRQEKSVHEENKRLENEFMNVFQTLS